jgi:hypothetical protein
VENLGGCDRGTDRDHLLSILTEACRELARTRRFNPKEPLQESTYLQIGFSGCDQVASFTRLVFESAGCSARCVRKPIHRLGFNNRVFEI